MSPPGGILALESIALPGVESFILPGIPLTAGVRFGAYEILSILGAGGMGEVYRARDPKLNRDVAIKVLLPAVANDPDRLARFSREAQVLASLNHPNIAHIHGLDETEGVTALILEFVDGEDLAQRIRRGPIPLDEALPIARQITEALEAAHDHGIIHRDLKPANIKVRADGTVKVLDFGLAKAVDPAAGSSESALNSPTLSNHATAAGSILGTAAYMSPEQAAGKTVDKRSDLWAFGVVLIEMLIGRRLFNGETASHVIAAVLKDEPDWAALPADTPAAVRRLLRRCLQKDRKLRLADAADARLEITEAETERPEVSQAVAVPARAFSRRELTAWGLAAILAVAALASAMRPTAPATDTATMRFSLAPPGGSTFHSASGGSVGWGSPLNVSPDGRRIVMVLVDADGRQRLWLRTLDTTTPQLLPGTEGASGPFWSPDSRWIAFFAQGKLKRIPLTGGDVQILCDSGRGGGGTWNRDDVIVFASASAGEGGLARVPAGGGKPEPLTTLDATRGETNHLWPQFLPDGRHYIYVVGAGDASGLYVGQLDSSARDMVLDTSDLGGELSRVQYASPGYLLFVRNRALMAQRFDTASMTASGEVVQVADNVLKEGPGSSAFSASDNGVLAYWSGAVPPDSQLTWLARDGTPAGIVGPPAGYFAVALAPDERTVAVSRFEPNEISMKVALWLIDVPRNTSTKFTFGTGSDYPVWSRDGARIAFSTAIGGPPTVFQKRADTVGGDERLLRSVASTRPTDWSADGATLMYQSLDSVSRWDLWLLDGAGKAPIPFLRTPSSETDARISPDGRWAAYVSDESGAREVDVTGFPKPLGKWPISTTGGNAPEWRRDSKELYYVSANGKLMAVPVTVVGAAIAAGAPTPLFAMPVVPATAPGYSDAQFAVSNDGRRFLVRVPIGETSVLPATVMVNWATGIRK